MPKQHVLDEIRRTARENDGKPLGRQAFTKQTGIKDCDWYGKLWTRWGDALQEAGFAPNQLRTAFDESYLVRRLIELMRELQPPRFPVVGDLRIKARSTPGFPSHTAFTRLGSKSERAAKVAAYCAATGGLHDIAVLCGAVPPSLPVATASSPSGDIFGFVYLLRSGRHYKIGRTNSTGRRERELAIQLPDKVTLEHEIRTDDPLGIEAYWHRRFQAKRKNGE